MSDRPIGVLLLNLGGPADRTEVARFIRNLLADPEVVGVPWPVRPALAWSIAALRAPKVARHYAAIGGGSPIGPLTADQAAALAGALGDGFMVRHAFRHSPPRVAGELAAFAVSGAREVVAVPLYPQWSASTSGSALAEIRELGPRFGLVVHETGSFPDHAGYVEATIDRLRTELQPGDHVIVAAHGLPERAVRRGDPYVTEVRATAAAITAGLCGVAQVSLAYQSRLGPVPWTRPYLDEEIRRFGAEGVRSVLVVPVSFVVENFETLFELDIQLAEIAAGAGITRYRRARTVGSHPRFIAMLADLVGRAVGVAA